MAALVDYANNFYPLRAGIMPTMPSVEVVVTPSDIQYRAKRPCKAGIDRTKDYGLGPSTGPEAY